jgi:hypothetical protein
MSSLLHEESLAGSVSANSHTLIFLNRLLLSHWHESNDSCMCLVIMQRGFHFDQALGGKFRQL